MCLFNLFALPCLAILFYVSVSTGCSAGSTGFFVLCRSSLRHSSLSDGSNPTILHLRWSSAITCCQVFFGLPLGAVPATSRVVTRLIQSGLLYTCPYHLSLSPRKIVSMACRFSLWCSVSIRTWSISRTLHIHRSIVLSVRLILSMSFLVGAQHSHA